MSAESKGSLIERRVKLKSNLPFLRDLSLRAKNTQYEEKLLKIIELIETRNLDIGKVGQLETTIEKLKNIPKQTALVPVPIKIEIPFTTEQRNSAEKTSDLITAPANGALTPPISDAPIPAPVVKKEPTPDPNYHQSHISTDEESAGEEVPVTPPQKKRGRPPGSKSPQKKAKTKELRDEPQEKMRKLEKRSAESLPVASKITSAAASVKVPLKPSVVIKPAEPLRAKASKPSIGPLKTKTTKKSNKKPTEVQLNVTEPASNEIPKDVVSAPEEPTAVQPPSNTDDDNKVNELKNLLQDITRGDAKDPKLLDSFENILGKEGFIKLKSLFVGNFSPAECKPEPEPQTDLQLKPQTVQQLVPQKPQQSPVVTTTQPTQVNKKPDRSDLPLKMPPVSSSNRRGKKRTEVDRLNQDIMDCFIRDGVLNASGLRNVHKVKYEGVIAMEDYALDAGSCSDTDTDEPLVIVQREKREAVKISKVETAGPSTSHELSSISPLPATEILPALKPLPATKPCFIFDKKVELNSATMTYRLHSGITGEFEFCEELKRKFLGKNFTTKDLQGSSRADSEETIELDIKPRLKDIDFGPMETIIIEDDDIEIPSAEATTPRAMESNFEVITIDDDESSESTIDCPILEGVLNHRETATSAVNGDSISQPEEEDLIYKQLKESSTALNDNLSSEKTVFNLSFYEDGFMRCRAEKCSYRIDGKSLFRYHVQTRHCLVKWDGSCKLCKGRSVSSYGSLLDEFDHMDSYHMSKLQVVTKKLQDPASPSLRLVAIPSALNNQDPSPSNQIGTRPIVFKVITQPTCQPILSRPPINQATPLNTSTLRLRSLPGDKLSGGNQSSNSRINGVQESPVKNTVIAPSTNALISGNIVLPHIVSLAPGIMPANKMIVQTVPRPVISTVQVPTSPRIPTTVEQYSAPVTVSVIAEPHTRRMSTTTSSSSFSNNAREISTRCLRPWLDDSDNKKEPFVKRMLQLDCLRSLYKCMGRSCEFFTNDSTAFGQHVALHAAVYANSKDMAYFSRCAYCRFSAQTVSALMAHIKTDHNVDVYGCTQCFYRAILPDTVRDHEKMFHTYTGILIRGNHECNETMIFKDAVAAARENRKQFLTPISCAGCFLKFHHLERYIEHLRSAHNSQNTQFRCNKCKKLTDCETIGVHMEKCHKIMKFHCLQCPLGFSNLNDLRKHFTNHHPNKLPFFCERSIEKCNAAAPQSSPESVVLQFLGDISRNFNVRRGDAALAATKK